MAAPTTTTRAPPSPPVLNAPFRFKSTPSKKRSCSPLAGSFHTTSSHNTHRPSTRLDQVESDHQTGYGHRKHGHRKKRRRRSTSPPKEPPSDIDPDVTFRETLFDAMADDEGAEFYARAYNTPVEAFDRSKLEQMGEEEYATYVRTQMWLRTPEYLDSERQRKDRERTRAKLRAEEELKAARRRKKRADFEEREKEQIKERWGEGVDDWYGHVVLGQRELNKVDWEGAWKRYVRGWKELGQGEDLIDLGTAPQPLNLRIPYPLLSGKSKDITSDAISEFLQHCPAAFIPDAPAKTTDESAFVRDHASSTSASRSLKKMRDVEAVLKAERLRWHPDKIQQRFGPGYAGGIDADSMKVVTQVFQIVDSLLGRIRIKLVDAGKGEARKAGDGARRFW